jgi:glutamyl-tRNA reductase
VDDTPNNRAETRSASKPFRIASICFAHPRTPAEIRAGLSLEGRRLADAYQRVAEAGIDAFLLSTCMRVEITCLGPPERLQRVLALVFPDRELPPTGVLREDRDALHHLYRVAAGLDSPLIGEPEVLGQFRLAVETGTSAGTLEGMFHKMLTSSVGVGRAARKMLPDLVAGSLALVAADLAEGAEEVAVFGAGAMARAAVNALQAQRGVRRVVVYARRPEAVPFPVDEIRPISDAPRALTEAPVVVSATAAKRVLFDANALDRTLADREDELLLLDLAMPPDFLPSEHAPNLRYLNVDALAERARGHSVADDVEAFVANTADQDWVRLSNHHRVAPVIAAIRDGARAAVEEEVARFAGKLDREPSQVELLERLAASVANRLLHRPLSYLGSSSQGAEAAPILAEAFGVKDDD